MIQAFLLQTAAVTTETVITLQLEFEQYFLESVSLLGIEKL